MTEKIWSVYVGGAEVNNYYLTKSEAEELADEHVEYGFNDVYIVDTNGNEELIKE